MIVPAPGHRVRCIPWVQMGTFNKKIGFLSGLQFFALTIFVANTYNRVYIWCCKYGEAATVKDVAINNDALQNIQAC